MQNIDVSDAPFPEPRGKIRRIISPAGRHRAAAARGRRPTMPVQDLKPSQQAAPTPSPVSAVPSRPQIARLPDLQDQSRLDSIVMAYQQMILERVDQGIARMQQSAANLMGEIAGEVWRGAGPDAGENFGERVLGLLARDDSVRGLIAHSDERYHALDVRLQRMEAGLKMVADKLRQSHVALVADLEGMRQSVTTNLTRAAEQNERNLVALSEQLDTTGRRLHSRLVHATERLETQTARIEARIPTQLEQALAAMLEGIRQLDHSVAATPDLTARRVATATGMVGDQVEAAAGALVRRVAKVSDAAVERVVAATEAAAGHAVTTAEALAARVAARTEAAAGRALQATEDLAGRLTDTTAHAAERMEATSEALVNRFDAMGRVLVRAAARETEAVVALERSLKEMHAGLEDMSHSLGAIQRDVSARPFTVVSAPGENEVPGGSIDEGFFATGRRRRAG